MGKIKVSLVSYLNTKPLLFGLENHPIRNAIELSLDVPSEGARKLKAGEVDLGLIPVAAIPSIHNAEIVSHFCIGATGPVKSVCLFGQSPVEEMDEIILDYQSRTSVELVQILCREYWHVEPTFIKGAKGYEKSIGGNTGGLIIGDRALELYDTFEYAYDLGECWKKMTGLPFVFAAWVSVKKLSHGFITSLNEALQQGIDNIEGAIQYYEPQSTPKLNLHEYFTRNISYTFDSPKQEALNLFLQKMENKKEILI